MAQMYSTALVNRLTGGESLRAILDDCVLRIYSGAAPATADAAYSGTLLCEVTKSSGSYASTDYELPQLGTIKIKAKTNATVFSIALTVDSVGPTTCTLYTAAGSPTTAQCAQRVARAINKHVSFAALQAVDDNVDHVWVTSRIAGLTFTLANGGTTTSLSTTSSVRTATTGKSTVKFGVPSAGVISKTTAAWTGTNLANGVAGYFRLVRPNDSDADDSSALAYPRVQGSVGTSGADLNLDSVQFVASATTTISNFSIQEPKSA